MGGTVATHNEVLAGFHDVVTGAWRTWVYGSESTIFGNDPLNGYWPAVIGRKVRTMSEDQVNNSVYDWDAEAAEREQYADVMAADLADQRRMDRQAGQ